MNIEYMDGAMLKKAFLGAAQFLDEHKEEVNELNVFPVPDGDTGTNMSLTMKSAAKHVYEAEAESVSKIAMAASDGALMGARGNSGVILSQLFRGFATGLKDVKKATTKDLARAFDSARETAYKAVMKPTEGTILTVARHCAEVALKLSRHEKDVIKFCGLIIEEGNDILNKTPEMLPVLKQAGVVDAGGKGLMCVLIGAYNGITSGEDLNFDSFESAELKKAHKDLQHSHDHGDIDIEFGYCTEFMIETDYDYESFREEIKNYGDSMLVVGANGLIKTHIHTNNPGAVLEEALKHGELHDIKIDNMRYQHRHLITDEEELEEVEDESSFKEYGFVTVSAGEGLSSLFKELHVDKVIEGGQTMNPSTEDIVKAIDSIKARKVVVLPNNSNIVLAAEQAKTMAKREVFVYPTKTIPEGVTALLNFNGELSIEENFENIEEAVAEVITAQVTYAVRDTEINDKVIKKDDIIGLIKGDILAVGQEVDKVSIDLIKDLVDEDSSLITIYYGKDVKEEDANSLLELLEEEFDEFDIELVYGGQPVYYYLFSIE